VESDRQPILEKFGFKTVLDPGTQLVRVLRFGENRLTLCRTAKGILSSYRRDANTFFPLVVASVAKRTKNILVDLT